MTLDEIRKLCDEATPGPWRVFMPVAHRFGEGYAVLQGPERRFDRDVGGEMLKLGDAAFIAAARTLLPALLEIADAAESAVGTSPSECLDSHDTLREALAALESLKLP